MRKYTAKFMFQFPECLKMRLDSAVQKTGISKSEILRNALAAELERIEARK